MGSMIDWDAWWMEMIGARKRKLDLNQGNRFVYPMTPISNLKGPSLVPISERLRILILQISFILSYGDTQDSPFLRIKYLSTTPISSFRRLHSLPNSLSTTTDYARSGWFARSIVRVNWSTKGAEYTDWRWVGVAGRVAGGFRCCCWSQ